MVATPHRRALTIRQQLQTMAGDSTRWAAVDRCLQAGHWAEAVAQLQALAADLQTAQRGLSSLATAINRRHWSPLLEQGQTGPQEVA